MARVAYHVGTDVEYAHIQEFGGTIVPKTKKALHFKIDGEDIFVRKVTLNPQPYMRPAFDTKHAEAAKKIGEVFGELILAKVS